jgi:hypothetical protein
VRGPGRAGPPPRERYEKNWNTAVCAGVPSFSVRENLRHVPVHDDSVCQPYV